MRTTARPHRIPPGRDRPTAREEMNPRWLCIEHRDRVVDLLGRSAARRIGTAAPRPCNSASDRDGDERDEQRRQCSRRDNGASVAGCRPAQASAAGLPGDRPSRRRARAAGSPVQSSTRTTSTSSPPGARPQSSIDGVTVGRCTSTGRAQHELCHTARDVVEDERPSASASSHAVAPCGARRRRPPVRPSRRYVPRRGRSG